jgi:2'-hydroxyisoflavone reductase
VDRPAGIARSSVNFPPAEPELPRIKTVGVQIKDSGGAMSNRREFLTQAVAAGSALALCATNAGAAASRSIASKPLRVLILGGTGFIGPHHVRAAVARGHKVAVFNRGKDHADLPASVERLLGDRNGNLDSIKSREWDAVIDLATYGPGWVRSLSEALRGRVKHYTFISTISVYDNPAANDTTRETSKVLAYSGKADPYSVTEHTGADYGALKVLCEREAEAQFPNRTLILRAGYIVGPGDTNGFVTYWPVRVEKGGELLAAGDPSTPVQYIDVRDMAELAIRLVEKSATGTYNTVGPAAPTTYGQLVDAARETAPTPPKVTWVPIAWLAARKGSDMWGMLLFWHFQGLGGLTRVNIERALAAGFTTRPLSVTLADVLRWYKEAPQEQQVGLVTGHKKKEDGSWTATTASWPEYLEHERQVLAEWDAQQPA